jgi:hypothetical protein
MDKFIVMLVLTGFFDSVKGAVNSLDVNSIKDAVEGVTEKLVKAMLPH